MDPPLSSATSRLAASQAGWTSDRARLSVYCEVSLTRRTYNVNLLCVVVVGFGSRRYNSQIFPTVV